MNQRSTKFVWTGLQLRLLADMDHMHILGPLTAPRLCELGLTALVEDNQGRRINASSFEGLKLLFERDLWQKYLDLLVSHRYENRMLGNFFPTKVAPLPSSREPPRPHLRQALVGTARLLDRTNTHLALMTTQSLMMVMQYLTMTALHLTMRSPMIISALITSRDHQR